MAEYTGTITDFDKFIGPRLRNLVQTSIARKYKRDIGKCEICKCDEKKELEAAHVHGKDRKTIIRDILKKYTSEDGILTVELKQVEEDFKNSHYPLENTFRILCKSCHLEYDKKMGVLEVEDIEIENSSFEQSTLPIELYPEDTLEFKELLLVKKQATINIFYRSGDVEIRIWNALRFSETSDVIRNLRSRVEFRQNNWQENGIEKVEVVIED